MLLLLFRMIFNTFSLQINVKVQFTLLSLCVLFVVALSNV